MFRQNFLLKQKLIKVKNIPKEKHQISQEPIFFDFLVENLKIFREMTNLLTSSIPRFTRYIPH